MKGDYLKLLKETPNINESTPWDDIHQKIKSDPRYNAVNNDSKRENWFDEYVLTKVSIHVDTHSGTCIWKQCNILNIRQNLVLTSLRIIPQGFLYSK